MSTASKLIGGDRLKSILDGKALLTKAEADKLRNEHVARIQRYLDTDPEWKALKGKYNPAGVISYMYQTGIGNAIPGPNFRRKLKSGDIIGAYLELLNYKDPDIKKERGLHKAYYKKMRATFPLELLKTNPRAAYLYRMTEGMEPPANKQDRELLIKYLRQ